MANRIHSEKQLEQVKAEYLKEKDQFDYQVMVCGGGGCVSSNCSEVEKALRKALAEQRLDDRVKVTVTGCMGLCSAGPVMLVGPEGVFYVHMTAKKVADIVQKHLRENEIVAEYTYFDPVEKIHVPHLKNIPFYKEQVHIALRNCGKMPYSSLEAYIARGGYFALAKALKMERKEVVEVLKKSGLRGRGGAGFPTGIKWESGMKAPGTEKYLVCNADEGDPGAFMDRSLLEGDPHGIIEGMLIGGYTIGAQKGFIYVRAEYPLAVDRMTKAVEQAREAGLLGKNIFGSDFDFDIELRIGAGAFVCGEETALLASLEGRRGEPSQKPPFPFEAGLFNKPTIINNVETLANVAPIVLKGADWYCRFGTEKSKGTKVFALAGNIVNSGIIEVPMGTALGDIIYNIGGGIIGNKKFKAVQSGGPSGGCLTVEHLNVPVDYESLASLGAIMGSGGLIVMNEDTCMVDTARYFMDFIQDESCGKCLPCRVGTKRMLEILEKLTEGRGQESDLEMLEEIAITIRNTAMCGLGQTAPNPVLSTIKYFRDEYETHIHEKHCNAGVCSELYTAPCQNACPASVNVPGYMALVA
ncbi:MAG TPA: NADH-quinone oxidoreductase subunit NuoF, partial [Firmicutes bacterium]|nr:NADH-quinone oxidoreductase subunit NuoF [Bacillota bacterium]